MGLDIDLYTPKIDIDDDSADDIIIEITGLKSINKFIGLEDTPLYYDNGKFFKVENNKIVYTDIQWKDISGDISESPEIVAVISDLVNEVASDIIDKRINLHNLNEEAHPYIQNIIKQNYDTLDAKIDNTKEELSEALNTEITNRQTADTGLQSQITSNYNTLDSKIDSIESSLNDLSDTVDANDTAINNKVDNINNTLTNSISTLSDTVSNNYTTLDNKIDSVEGALADSITALDNKYDNITSGLDDKIDDVDDTLTTHISDNSNPHNVTKTQVGLSNVDNTSDLDKPISTATQTALDGKVPNTRTVNNKPLSSDIVLDYSDVNALPDTTTINDLTTTAQQNALNSGIDSTLTQQITTNQNNISNLSSTVSSNYTTLDNRITSEVNTLNGSISDEETARINADNGLQSQIDAITSASDVTDIVGTYAELQAYDTTSLPDKSIIKVLQDESRNNETTYYRWVITNGTGAWVLIGEEGPYYTKSETDGRFVNQTTTVNNKALSSNITLTASDVGALPDSTVIGDGTLTIQKNGTTIDTFTANTTSNKTINITIPTDTQDLTNGAGYITNSALNGYATENFVLNQGYITGITSTDVTTALGYVPYNSTNPSGYTTNVGTVTSVNNTQPDANGNVTLVIPDTATWGNITGTLSNQTDLQNALDAKQDVLTSENAGNCIEIAMGGSSGLPAEYQEVEYLQSSGTQYINTGVVLDDTMTIRIKYDFIRAGFVFGSRNSSSSRYSGITNETGGAYNIRYGNTVIYSQNTTPSGTVDVVISPNGVVLNGEEVSTTAYGDSFYLGNCFLFTTNNNGSPTTSEYAINRIRRFTIDNIIDLVPCKRKSDDVLGMYDLINDEFLTNAGTGTFIAGGDVEEITKISFVNDAGYITGADLPTNHVTTNTAQTISGDKEFTGVTRFQNGSGNGCVILGADVANTTVSTNTRKLGRMSFHTYTNTLDCAFVSTDADDTYNYVEFGGRRGDITNTSPDILRFTVANSHNSKDKTHALEISYSGGANFTVLPKYNGVNLATKTYVDNGLASKQTTSNLVTSISSSSTDTQYPSAKCVYDIVGDIETALNTINSGV